MYVRVCYECNAQRDKCYVTRDTACGRHQLLTPNTLFGYNWRHTAGHLGAGSARLGSFSIIPGTCKKSPDRIMRRMTNCGDHSPAAVTEVCAASRASNEGLQRFHNHGEGPYSFSWLKVTTSVFTFKTLC